MDFISNKEPQIQLMLQEIGVESLDELFKEIPTSLLCSENNLKEGLSEFEAIREIKKLSQKNTFHTFESYLGGGAYEHHVPAFIDPICSKSEFLTGYTPYQAEASQGMLQAIFEFQSAICALTGMDVANASLYDGASSCAEAVLLALRAKKPRNKILIAETLHPHYKKVVSLYIASHHCDLVTIPMTDHGTLDLKFIQTHMDAECACIFVQSPNFFGMLEEVQEIAKMAHAFESLMLLSANPLAFGVYQSAKELDVDVCVGDCQPFGIPLQFGGPYAGYMACKKDLMRQMPGRIAGQTHDTQGKRGYVLTLQAREQNIRREKATSNICTNQALTALASLLAMLWYGKKGIPKLSLTNFQRASYLRESLSKIPFNQILGKGSYFNEFAIKFSKPLTEVIPYFRKQQIEPGLDLGKYFPHKKDYLLVCVTETKSKEQLDHYCQIAKEIGKLS